MTITSEEKLKVIARFQRDHKDSGSPELQVAILSSRIKNLTEHFKVHKKDHHSRRGLLALVSKRKKLLNYLKRIDYDKYLRTIQELELRK